MGKKSAHSEEELPFAALMDVMTNVVGVLIIVLVMTGITLAQVAKKVIAQIEIVSKDDFEKIKKEAQSVKQQIDPEKIKEQLRKIEQQMKAIPKIERAPVKVDQKLADLGSMKAKIEEAKKERDKQKEQVNTYLTKIDELKNRLDTKPRYVPPPPPDMLKMPNPRPLPAKPVVRHVWITNNSVITSYAEKKFTQELHSTFKQAAREMGLSGPKVEFDTQQLADYMNKNFYPKFKDLSINGHNWSPWHGGITFIARAKDAPDAPPFENQIKMGSPFYNLMKEVSSEGDNGVIFFHVAPGALENYVKAREVADRMKINVGWDMEMEGTRESGDLWNFFGVEKIDGVAYYRKVDPNATPPPQPKATPDTRLIKGHTGKTLD